MKKSIIIILLFLIIIIGFTINNLFNVVVIGKQTESNIIRRAGVVIIGGDPKYFDPTGLFVPDMFMSPKYRDKIKSEIITAGLLEWGGEEDPNVYIYDVRKDRPYWRLPKTKRILQHKVEQNKLYLSENNGKWEEVKFRVVNDEEHIKEDDPLIKVYWVIYLECKWFKGEYEIISVPNT